MEESMKRAEAGAGGEFEPAVLDAVRDWLAQQARSESAAASNGRS
jgi:hypothetical protein